MAAFILETVILLLLFGGVLGYKFRMKRICLAISIVGTLVCGSIFVFFPEMYLLQFFVKGFVPALIMSTLFSGNILILSGISICFVRILAILDHFYIGIWILVANGNAMSVDLVMTYLLGQVTCLLVLGLLTGLLGGKRTKLHQYVEHINPVLLVLVILCSILLQYSPWYTGESSSWLPEIIHGRNLVKDGILAIAVIGAFFLLQVTLLQKKELKRIVLFNERCIREQAEQYHRIGLEDETIRKFRHDYNAHISALQTIVYDGDTKRIRRYVDSLAELKPVRQIIYSNNLVCDGILSQYLKGCSEENIAFRVCGTFPEGVVISDTDLCILISNGMGNAFEAVRKCATDRRISVDIGNIGSFLLITITNTVAEPLVIKGGKLLTTKKSSGDHGLGTQNMQEAARRNNGHVKWRVENETDLVTEIMIQYTNES